jgi:hypothetical protein
MRHVASSAIAGLLSAVVMYAALRMGQVLFGTEADPAAILYSEHSGYLWRVTIALYAGGIVAIVTSIVEPRSPERTQHVLAWLLPFSALALVVQALFIP